MIIEICFLLFMLLYWFSEGCTEGYTWATAKQRKTNKLIFGHIKKGKPTGKGILDYHSWRLGENIGTVGCILGAYSLGIYMETNFYDLIKIWIGSWMMGYFIYERALNYICFNDAFKIKGDYHLMNLTIPRSNKFDWCVFVIGFIIFCLGV